jgi:hypothetical protein
LNDSEPWSVEREGAFESFCTALCHMSKTAKPTLPVSGTGTY